MAAAVLSLMMTREAGASGACVSARFHDWNNMGCNQNFAGAGGPTITTLCPTGLCSPPSSASKHGMPQWWVSEPYISLNMEDTPLSYTTSSGQEMAFRFYYAQRTQLPGGDEIAPSTTNLKDLYSYPGALNGYTCGTNASWGNNWTMSVQVWDSTWDSNWYFSGSQYTWGSLYYAPFTKGYQALVWRPEGGMNYFTVVSGSLFTTDPQSQVKIQPASTNGYPVVETFYTSITGATMAISNQPTADVNSIYWGDAGIGVKLVYPDGSQDVFGLSAYQNNIPPNGSFYFNTPVSSTRLLLTQRIDPQGRATCIGYEHVATNGYYPFYRVRFVVDPDGRTNSFRYNGTNASSNGFQVKEIDDPYGRKTSLTYTSNYLNSIVDAAKLTNSFAYLTGGSGCISTLTTPYGNTSFSYYDVPDSSPVAPNCYIQRAIYINEPAGAQQLYCYIHNNSNVAPANTAPSVSGQAFDDGNSGSTLHYALSYRNTYHWDRRQFTALSSTVQSDLYECFVYPAEVSSWFSQALSSLTGADFNKARIRHWLMSSSDDLSITEALSSEVDPSPDSGGAYPGLRTWYNYAGKPSAELLGSNPQASCVARLLPDGSSQYTTYNYYSLTGFPSPPAGAGLVSDSESTYSLPGGGVGVLTNWFHYATNNIDLVSINNSAGQYVNYGYNSGHQIKYVTNALNQVTSFSWDEGNTWNLTGIQFPGGKSISLSYYASANPPTSTGSLLKQVSISPEGRSFTNNNYSAGLPSNITDDRGLTIANTWDGLNRLTSTTFPDSTTISNTYYRLDLVGTKDRLGNWTRYAYDGLQHLTAVTNANNAVTTYSWCGCGSLTTITDALNYATSLNYDNQGNLTSVYFPDSSSLTYQYDLAGRMTNAFDGAGRNVQLAYNNQGLPTTVTVANGQLRQTFYDALNRPTSVTDANGISVTNQFDAINELVKRTWPDGISEGYGYSAAGLIAYTNRDQKATIYGRDGAGRLIAVTNANTETTQFTYDSLNNVTSLTDGLQHQTTWQYNEYGWLTNKVDGLNRNAFRYGYNVNGWLTSRWTPEKGNTTYAYDNVGNLKSIAYPQQTNSFAYDALNRLTNMVDAVGTTAFSYTPAGQLASENGPWTSDTVSNTYVQDLRTALNLLQASTNWSQSYGYDSSWRMTNITSPAGTFSYSYGFQPASALVTGIALPNGAKIVNAYDSLARLTQTSLNNYWGHPLDSYTNSYDALGLRTNIVRNLGLTFSTVTAGYDNIGQLTSWNATEAGGALRQNEQLGFGYDAAHNLHTRNNGNLAQTFTTDAANQLNSVSRTGTFTLSGATPAPATNVTVNGLVAQTYGDFTFATTNLTLTNGQNCFTTIAQNVYGLKATNILSLNLPANVTLANDNNGNLTNDGVKVMSYDSENQLTNVTVSNSIRKDFVYDGLNRLRIKREYGWTGSTWSKTNEMRYIWDGNAIIQLRDSNNVPTLTLTRGLDLSGSLQGAGGIGGLLAMTENAGASSYYHQDGFGNVTALMDAGENIVARRMFDGFGRTINLTGGKAGINPFWASSQLHDEALDMDSYLYRDLFRGIQRWSSTDPTGLTGGINPYGFVENDPLNEIDPLGLYGWSDYKQDFGDGWNMVKGGVSDAATSAEQFFTGKPGGVTPDANSLLALNNQAGVGNTPLSDGHGHCETASHLIFTGVFLPVLLTPLAPEKEGVALTTWRAASDGRQVINGIEYTVHALERMSPVGLIQKGTEIVSRGVPTSVVENAIKYGIVSPGNSAAEVIRTYENVQIVTNPEGTRVISVIKTGH